MLGNPPKKKAVKNLQQKKIKSEFKQFPQLSQEPPLPPEEDEASYARNNKLLLSEEKKTNPNKSTIGILMERTYAFC